MGGADFQARKAIERAFEDHMRERDRRFQRIADDIAQHAIALHAPIDACDDLGTLRMHEDDRLQLLRLLRRRLYLARAFWEELEFGVC